MEYFFEAMDDYLDESDSDVSEVSEVDTEYSDSESSDELGTKENPIIILDEVEEVSIKQEPEQYVEEVMKLIHEYINVITTRLTREGNYSHYFNDTDDTEVEWFEPVHFKKYQLRIETLLRVRDEVMEYVMSFHIQPSDQRIIPIKEIILWAYVDEDETDFEMDDTYITDALDEIKPKIERFSRYLPFTLCKNKECNTILTNLEKEYCFECKNSMTKHMCSICLDDHTPKLVLTTSCGHTFHRDCFHNILPSGRPRVKCPLCRTYLFRQNGQ